MKKWFTVLVFLIIFLGCLYYHEEIINYLIENFTEYKKEQSTLSNNQYAKDNNYQFIQITDNFTPQTKQDILNIYYTVLNSGMTSFTFYCGSEYEDCIKDIDYISNNQKLLSEINNFVPVYNSFDNIETNFDSLGKVTINISHNYNADQIVQINAVVDEIINQNINDTMSNEQKIKIIHDYIINNTKYDVDRSDNKITHYKSDSAYGVLIEHYGICGGYSDSMKLFLDRFNIPNYKIVSENHIWNLVYVNDNWLHLDLTWDDPVTSTGEDVLEYDYFLITTDELMELESEQHLFNKDIYLELKSS